MRVRVRVRVCVLLWLLRGREKFTDAIISKLNRHGGEDGKPIVFLCWGKPAQTKALHIDKKKHTVLTSSHPSPLGSFLQR